MATTARRFLGAAILLALAVGTVSGVRQRRSWIAGGIDEEVSSSCVRLKNDSCVRSFFVRGLTPQVGYPDSDDPTVTLTDKENEFKSLGLDRMVCDEQCFSNLPNLATFLTYVYFPPCDERRGVVTPCLSLCEAAREEYGRYSDAEMTLACPMADSDAMANGVNSMQFENVLDLEIFNCSQYITEGTCVPKRTPSMSCVFIPSTHAARLVHPAHFQTGYPSENSVSQITHLRSFDRANADFKNHGLEAMVNDIRCRRRLPNTMFFLTFAYFPVCTAHKDSDSSLAYPCSRGCVAARQELQRYVGRERELCRHCPAACNITMSIDQVLAQRVFATPIYPDPPEVCVETPDYNAVIREPEPPERPTCNCTFNESVCRREGPCSASIRNKVNANSFNGKQFGK